MKFVEFCIAAKHTIGDLARPFAIIATSAAAAAATVTIALKIEPTHLSLTDAGIFIGAVFAGVGALYGAKAAENIGVARHDASVRIAQAQAPQQ